MVPINQSEDDTAGGYPIMPWTVWKYALASTKTTPFVGVAYRQEDMRHETCDIFMIYIHVYIYEGGKKSSTLPP